MEKNTWWKIKNQNLAVYARKAGFDLAIYDLYAESVQRELRKHTIKEAMSVLRDSFEEETEFSLGALVRGVYVISLSDPLSIQYRASHSPVIYIGQGNVQQRIKKHFEGSLFWFMQSLCGANFDFSFASPDCKGEEDYHKHVEYLMLEYFCEKTLGIDDRKRFPLLNKNSGSNRNISEDDGWWKAPLQLVGRKPLWTLSPTKYSHFAPLD